MLTAYLVAGMDTTVAAISAYIRCLAEDPPEPDRFDVGRNPVDHLAFGYASHGCAGQGLARIEAQPLISSLVRRLDRIELAGEPVRHEHPVVCGPESLPVTVVPAQEG